MDALKLLMAGSYLIAGVVNLRRGLQPVAPAPRVPGMGRLEKTVKKGGHTARVYTVRNINDRVKYIVKGIQSGREDPEVRKFALQVVNRKCGKRWCIDERDTWGEAKAIFDAVRENVRYTGDIYMLDTFQHPSKWTLKYHGGDCDDYTITLGSALQSIGHQVMLRIIQTNDNEDFNHIFLLDGIPPGDPQKWVALDASTNKPAGWHPPMNQIVKMKDYVVP